MPRRAIKVLTNLQGYVMFVNKKKGHKSVEPNLRKRRVGLHTDEQQVWVNKANLDQKGIQTEK